MIGASLKRVVFFITKCREPSVIDNNGELLVHSSLTGVVLNNRQIPALLGLAPASAVVLL